MQTSARLLFKQIVIVLGAIGFTCQAQSQRTCDSYVGKELASEILGKMLANDPGKGQYSKDQNLEWHLCQWVVDYPPVAPGAPRNPASLFVSIQRYPTLDAMRKGLFASHPR